MRIASLRIGGNEGTYASQLHEWLKRKDIKENKKREKETTKNSPSSLLQPYISSSLQSPQLSPSTMTHAVSKSPTAATAYTAQDYVH